MKLLIYDYINVDNKLYFTALNNNALFMYDVRQEKIKILSFFMDEEDELTYSHSKILYHKGSLWMIPNNSIYIYEYEIKCKELRKYEIPQDGRKERYSYFLNAEIKNDMLYIFPCRYNGIVVFDLCNKNIRCIINVDELKGESNSIFSYKGATIVDDKIIIASYEKDMYLCIDIQTKEKEEIYLKEIYDGITKLFVNNHMVIVIGNNGKVGVYNLYNKELLYIYDNKKEDKLAYFDACVHDNDIYLALSKEYKILKINYINKDVVEINIPYNIRTPINDFPFTITFLKLEGKKIVFQNFSDGNLYSITDNKVNKMVEMDWIISEDERNIINKDLYRIIRESNHYNLSQYIRQIVD